jgi:transposase InsO family protein
VGLLKCYDALRLDGQPWNHKRVHRVYCALRLNLPLRTRRRVPRRIRAPLIAAAALNTTWALDFMVDTLYDGRRFRTLNIIDESNREGLAIEIGTTVPAVGSCAISSSPGSPGTLAFACACVGPIARKPKARRSDRSATCGTVFSTGARS